jgi:hypothetical protein
MLVKKIEINWHSGLPIFASEPFLQAVGHEYGWLGGFDESSSTLRFILPYTIVHRQFLRLVRFRVEPILLDETASADEEKSFLNKSVDFFRSTRSGLIMPAANTALFRTFPDGAQAVPFGSYIIDLTQPEEMLWRNISKDFRNKIRSAEKSGVQIKTGPEYFECAYDAIKETLHKSSLRFSSISEFKTVITGLGENVKVFAALHRGIVQGCLVAPYSAYSAYSWYSGRHNQTATGAMHLLRWEAIRMFKEMGVRVFNNTGSRINPEKGSKHEGLNDFKKRFGGSLKQGFMWKYPLHPFSYFLYNVGARIRSGGDIVDMERNRHQQ